MSAYLSLLGAIVFEVAGTLMLPLTKEFSEKLPTVIMSICYFVSFYFLTLALRAIPLAIVYACWSGSRSSIYRSSILFYLWSAVELASDFRIILNSKWSNSC